jgi:hypothetical protein
MYPRLRGGALRLSVHSRMHHQSVHTLSRIPIPTHQASNPRAPPFARQIIHAVRNDQAIVAVATRIVRFAIVVTEAPVSPPNHQLKLLIKQSRTGTCTYSKNWQFQ